MVTTTSDDAARARLRDKIANKRALRTGNAKSQAQSQAQTLIDQLGQMGGGANLGVDTDELSNVLKIASELGNIKNKKKAKKLVEELTTSLQNLPPALRGPIGNMVAQQLPSNQRSAITNILGQLPPAGPPSPPPLSRKPVPPSSPPVRSEKEVERRRKRNQKKKRNRRNKKKAQQVDPFVLALPSQSGCPAAVEVESEVPGKPREPFIAIASQPPTAV
jgi:hypothetical protein